MKCCLSTDVGTWTNWLTFEPDPDHSPDAGTGLLSPISYRCSCVEFYVRKIPFFGAPLQRAVVLKWFYSLSRRKTFVGGKCALPSALLVMYVFCVEVKPVQSSLLTDSVTSDISSWWPKTTSREDDKTGAAALATQSKGQLSVVASGSSQPGSAPPSLPQSPSARRGVNLLDDVVSPLAAVLSHFWQGSHWPGKFSELRSLAKVGQCWWWSGKMTYLNWMLTCIVQCCHVVVVLFD